MACLLVPAAEAVVTMVVSRSVKKKEELELKANTGNLELRENVIPFSRKLSWLTKMLSGGATLLAFEHVWHGEITPWFPFLTAANSPEDLAEMLHEMSTVGVTMALLVTAIWGCMVLYVTSMEKKAEREVDTRTSTAG